jgi:hypothetical protein
MPPAWALDGDWTVWTCGSIVPRGLGGGSDAEAVMSRLSVDCLRVENGTEASPRLRSAQCLPAANEGMDRSTCRAASDNPHRTGQDRTRASP